MTVTRDLTPAEFKLVAPYHPLGDQPRAIQELNEGIRRGDRYQRCLNRAANFRSISSRCRSYTGHSRSRQTCKAWLQ